MLIFEIPGNGNIIYSLNEITAENNETDGISNAQGRLCELWRGNVINTFWKLNDVTNFQN